MLKRWRNLKNVFVMLVAFCLASMHFVAHAQPNNALFVDHTHLVTQQLDLLKNRLAQANNQLVSLQHRPDNQMVLDQVNTQSLKQVNLDIAIAKSNLDSIEIELTESQQTILRIEKHVRDLENQLNILNVFGLKIARSNAVSNLSALQAELEYQKNLYTLEKNRLDYLHKLEDTARSVLLLYKEKYRRVAMVLKSHTIMRLKEEQEKSEINFQRQQMYWLEQLNDLTKQLSQVESTKNIDKTTVGKLESEIFFANENVNFTYLKMLIARYQDQIQQYRVSIARSISINLLNKIGDQAQGLSKQLARVDMLLKTRLTILQKRKTFIAPATTAAPIKSPELTGLQNLEMQYNAALNSVTNLNQQLVTLRITLDNALHKEISQRQVLPVFGGEAWLSLGKQLLWVPTLTFQVIKSLSATVYQTVESMSYTWAAILVLLESVFISVFYFLHVFLSRAVAGMADHELGHINLKWLGMKLLHKNLIDLALLVNTYLFFTACGIPLQNFLFIMYLGLVWLFFKAVMTAGQLVLIESVHDSAVIDIRLYRYLKWVVGIGGIVTAISVFLYQLPIIYEVQDLFGRIFLLYVLIISIFLLKSWKVVPDLILLYIEDRRTYLKKVVRLLGLFIPLILLTNSAIGLFGYVNLVITVSWYESVFLIVLVGYLIVRGFLIEAMERASYVLIRHVTNGWLWTEAFLKPIDKILRIALFLFAWAVLFILYGWDQQSPVVDRMNKLLQYHMADVLNTTITPLSMIEVLMIISLLFWAARWTREFVYRFLMSRTKDLGLRNSIAILSQYMTVFIGILICLRVLGIDLKALAVVTGMFFFAVGLGLRDLFNNFACGFLLLIERPIRVGDTVTINGTEGDVIHIGSRAVTIRTWDHMELVVPNTEIFSKTFMNWTGKDNIVRSVFPIKVNRHDSPHEIQKLVYRVLANHKDVLKDPVPEVFMKEMSDEIEFEIRYYVNIRQVKSRISVRSEVLAAIWDIFNTHQIKPPYPQREVVLRNVPSPASS